MQIQRFDFEPHLYAEPKGPLRPRGGPAGGVASKTDPQSDGRTGGVENAHSQWASWREKVSDVPALREDVVAAARDKLARGEYMSRGSAERLAATELRLELFQNRP